MSDLTLKLVFEGSIRMGTGHAGLGLDEVVDGHMPLSAGGVKGVLRDESRLLLAPERGKDGSFVKDHPFVTAVFGGAFGRQCPWNLDVEVDPDEKVPVKTRASLRLNDGAAVPGALLVKEEAWVPSATLRLFQRGPLSSDGLPADWEDDPRKVRQAHLALVNVAARLVDKVGQRKTRGMGWVVFEADPARELGEDLAVLKQIKEASRG